MNDLQNRHGDLVADPHANANGASRQQVHAGDTAVLIRPPNESDRAEFIAQMRASEHLHRPWIFPPASMTASAISMC